MARLYPKAYWNCLHLAKKLYYASPRLLIIVYVSTSMTCHSLGVTQMPRPEQQSIDLVDT